MALFETIVGGFALAVAVGVAVVGRPLRITDAAPNPRDAAARIDTEFDGEFAETFIRSRDAAAIHPYVRGRSRVEQLPATQAVTLDDMAADKAATHDELVSTFAKFERLLGSLRAQSAACRARLEIEKANLAARTERLDREDAELAAFASAELGRMREALGIKAEKPKTDPDPAVDETDQQAEPQGNA